MSEDDELWRKPPDETLEELAEVIKAFDGSWEGTTTELVNLMEYKSTPNALSRHISKNADRLKEEYGITVTSTRTKQTRTLAFSKPDDDNDDNDGISEIPQFHYDPDTDNPENKQQKSA